ncbi:hypothetical protein SEA_REYNAULD_9 [Rhodococcus phage Reynauld]|uniref:Uncharacterized protein n=1 Tax=Rhodococcus phage Reynauld TaxID=3062845 RepID=A0ACD4UGT5_9CAUD|nr:hypothetical protein SEA_REYNAULD_9 [Rhodococcus phage Reynauld]
MTGVWIKRAEIPEAHYCEPPSHLRDRSCPTAQGGEKVADGVQGDLWACDGCGTVWKVDDDLHWQHANWWTQRKHHPRYTCGCRVSLHRTQTGACRAGLRGQPIVTHGRTQREIRNIRPMPPRGGGGVGSLRHNQKPTRTISDIANDTTTQE